MENDKNARCHEEGKHRRVEPVSPAPTSTLTCSCQRIVPEITKDKKEARINVIWQKYYPTPLLSLLNKSQSCLHGTDLHIC